MQTTLPLFTVQLPIMDRPQAVNEISPPGEAGGTASDGATGHPDARDAQLASDQARALARIIGNRQVDDEMLLIPGLWALDTRTVGDQDVIDPNRSTVRGPEPLDSTAAQELPPLPDEVDPSDTTGETSETKEGPDASAGAEPGKSAEAEPDLPEIGPQARPETAAAVQMQANLPGQAPKVTAQPASPGATAPDVPEPPEPGNIDIRR